jgi:dolichyldiphosphatase
MYYVGITLHLLDHLLNQPSDDDASLFSLALALVTLSPILLMVKTEPKNLASTPFKSESIIQAAYAALAVQTREFIIIIMWAGQLSCEGFNWLVKQVVKQDRPIGACTAYNVPLPRM